MSAILDDLRGLTERALIERERRKIEVERVADAEREQNKEKAITAAIDFYKNQLPGILREAAHNGNHEFSLFYVEKNYVEKTRMHHIAALCRADGLTTKFESYTSDHGDSSAPCISTEDYLIVSWK